MPALRQHNQTTLSCHPAGCIQPFLHMLAEWMESCNGAARYNPELLPRTNGCPNWELSYHPIKPSGPIGQWAQRAAKIVQFVTQAASNKPYQQLTGAALNLSISQLVDCISQRCKCVKHIKQRYYTMKRCTSAGLCITV